MSLLLPRWVVDAVIIMGMGYLIFVMTLAGWIAALRKGQAVTLLPMHGSRTTMLMAQMGLVLFSLAACAAFIYWLWIPLPIPAFPAASAIFVNSGLVLFVAGTALVVWARKTLGRMWGVSTSREVKLLPDHQLVTNGPYAFVRHPMYLGWWVALFGTLLVYRTWVLLLLLVMSLIVFYRRAQLEETILAARFGQEWQAYVKRTSFLVPLLGRLIHSEEVKR